MGTGLWQIHALDKSSIPIPSSLEVCFSVSLLNVLVTVERPSVYSLSLIFFLSQHSVALVPTFKHNRIDYNIHVLKTHFIFFKGNLQMIFLLSVTV